MSRSIRILAGAAAVVLAASLVLPAQAADATAGAAPAIADFGHIHAVPNAAYLPDAAKTHRIVFAVSAAAKNPGDINPGIERVARAVNLYTSAGVPLKHLKFVAIAYGPATNVALNDAQYKAAMGVANPNLPVIAALRKAGVDVAVCGQAVAEHHYQFDWIDPSVKVALSAIVAITDLESQGYSLMPLP